MAAVFRLRAHGKDGGNNMPIDYSIPAKFSQFGISLPSPLQAASTLASLRDQTARQEALKAEQSKQSTLATLLPNAINQDGSLNQSVVTQMATIDPDAVVKVGRMRDMMFPQLSQGALSPAKVDTVDESGNPVTKLVYPGQSGREVVYPKPPEPQRAPQRSTYKKDGYEITEEYDPAAGRYKEIARSRVADQGSKERQFDVNTELKLADDYRTESKDFAVIKRQYGIAKKALENPSAYGTLAAATTFMKTMDPGSVVRESELGMAMQATGALDRLFNYRTVIESGKVLTPDQRKELGLLLDQFYEASQDAQRNVNKTYRDRADNYGLNWRNIVTFNVDGSVPKQETVRPGEITIGADRVNPTSAKQGGKPRPPMAKMR